MKAEEGDVVIIKAGPEGLPLLGKVMMAWDHGLKMGTSYSVRAYGLDGSFDAREDDILKILYAAEKK